MFLLLLTLTFVHATSDPQWDASLQDYPDSAWGFPPDEDGSLRYYPDSAWGFPPDEGPCVCTPPWTGPVCADKWPPLMDGLFADVEAAHCSAQEALARLEKVETVQIKTKEAAVSSMKSALKRAAEALAKLKDDHFQMQQEYARYMKTVPLS